MRYLVAPTSFKGSLGAREAAEAMAVGIRDADPGAAVDICPVGDGGEGTAEILARSCSRFEERWTRTVDAMGREIDARWFLVREPGPQSGLLTVGAAIVDAASCLGITLIDRAALDPMRACSAGLGVMLRAVADEGVARVVVCLGGTATMDCGVGMADALGWRFTDSKDAPVDPGAATLVRIAHATPPAHALDADVVVLADVDAPLTGSRGAPRTFGPQKGATLEQVEVLDRGFALVARVVDCANPDAPGAGAAGGLGWALGAFCGATIRRGAPEVIEALDVAARAKGADVILTGEGRLDAQTAMGKSIAEVCRVARSASKPVVAIVGRVDGDAKAICKELGLDRIVQLCAGEAEDARAMVEARERIRAAASRIASDRTKI